MKGNQAWRRAAVGFVLFGGVGLIFFLGAHVFGLDGPAQARFWLAQARGPWALPAAVAVFAALAFLGAPQFVLIAAAVAAFGPWRGLAYSWTGTMVSSLVGFWLGRAFGARLLRDVGNEGLGRFLRLIARNAVMASLLIRLVPFAPFILVNIAAGATAMRTVDFALGTAIGIVPKIALTAFAGASVMQAFNGGGWTPVALAGAAALLWVAAGVAARRWLVRDSARTTDGPTDRRSG
jgi:uncharacterized membrane protein YdjX (TVP38/TMEM64 family)